MAVLVPVLVLVLVLVLLVRESARATDVIEVKRTGWRDCGVNEP